jgi:hypothetical protein
VGDGLFLENVDALDGLVVGGMEGSGSAAGA